MVLTRDPGGRFRTIPDPRAEIVEPGEALAVRATAPAAWPSQRSTAGARPQRSSRPPGPPSSTRSPSGTGRPGTASRSRSRPTGRRECRCSASRPRAPATRGWWRAKHRRPVAAYRCSSGPRKAARAGASAASGTAPSPSVSTPTSGLERGRGAGRRRPADHRDRGRGLARRSIPCRRRERRAAHLHAVLRPLQRRRDRVVVRRASNTSGGSVCDHRLNARLSTQTGVGYRSFAWAGEGFGTRIITNPLEPGGDGETNRGTYLRFDGTTFERMPGGGGNFRPGGAFSSVDEGWLEGPFHVTRNPEPVQMRDSWPVSARGPLTSVAPRARQRRRATVGAQALAAGPDGSVLRYQPGRGLDARVPAVLHRRGRAQQPARRGLARGGPRARCRGPRRDVAVARGDGLVGARPRRAGRLRGHLMDVAFAPGNPERGYAVGKAGALLRYGKSWTQDAAPARLRRRRTSRRSRSPARRRWWRPEGRAPRRDVLVNDGGGWHVDERRARAAALGPRRRSNCYAVAGLPDGGAVAAGPRRRADPRLGRLAVALLRPAPAGLDGDRGGRHARRQPACAPSSRSCVRCPTTGAIRRRRRRGDRPEPAAAAAGRLSPPRGRVRAARDRHRLARRAALGVRRVRRRPPAQVRPGARLRARRERLRLGGRRLERRAGRRLQRLLRPRRSRQGRPRASPDSRRLPAGRSDRRRPGRPPSQSTSRSGPSA